jgi:hypothetical protein
MVSLAQRCRDWQPRTPRWTVVMVICSIQLVSHCTATRRIIPNSGRRNSAMASKGQLKSSKPLFPRRDPLKQNPEFTEDDFEAVD